MSLGLYVGNGVRKKKGYQYRRLFIYLAYVFIAWMPIEWLNMHDIPFSLFIFIYLVMKLDSLYSYSWADQNSRLKRPANTTLKTYQALAKLLHFSYNCLLGYTAFWRH